jgi:hypothetical protein
LLARAPARRNVNTKRGRRKRVDEAVRRARLGDPSTPGGHQALAELAVRGTGLLAASSNKMVEESSQQDDRTAARFCEVSKSVGVILRGS